MNTQDDLRQAVDQQVNSLLEDYVKQLVGQQTFQIQDQITKRLDGIVGDVVDKVELVLTSMNTKHDLKQTIDQQVNALVETHVKQLVGQYTLQAQKQITQRLDLIIEDVVTKAVHAAPFPQASIPATSINWENFKIDSQLLDKLPTQYLGIEDLSDKGVNLTIMNDAVVVETQLVSKQVVAENITVTNLNITNTEQPWIAAIIKNVVENIILPDPTEQITAIGGRIDIRVNELADQISHSTEMKELDVAGEAYLSGVLYSTPGNKRVGINTMDPSDALTVWDQETEIVIGRHKNQESYIGSRRRQSVNIGANNKVGITIEPDGNVKINKLTLIGRTIDVSETVPGDAAKKGDIRLNNNPSSGQPVGWVCLDGNRWSGFGVIQ